HARAGHRDLRQARHRVPRRPRRVGRAAREGAVSVLALFVMAVRGFSRHRLRALLTALGIIIGVGAFITMVAIGSGASAKVSAQIASMGTNMLIASGRASNVGGVGGGSGSFASAAGADVWGGVI